MRRAVLLAAGAMAAAACGGGDPSVPAPSKLDEPVRMRTQTPDGKTIAAQFFSGPLPAASPDGPVIVPGSVSNLWTNVAPGQTGKKITGAANSPATAVAARLDGLGTGYWVAPVQVADNQWSDVGYPNAVGWTLLLDFARDIAPGEHMLELTAVDELDRHGEWAKTPLVVNPSIPSGDVVVSLSWDLNADLDLYVVLPDGTRITPKRPAAGGGVLDRDSNAGCAIDSIRRENAVFSSAPAGTYGVEVDLFMACGQPAVTFQVDVYRAGQVAVSRTGRLLSIDADNGAGPFLLVTKFAI